MEIVLERLWHKNKDWVAVKFKYDVTISNLFRKVAGCRWSNTHKAWLLDHDENNMMEVCKLLNMDNTITFKDDLKKITKPSIQISNSTSALFSCTRMLKS